MPEGRGIRVPELDGLRGVAVLLVLAHHYTKDLPAGGAVDRLVLAVGRQGWIGVDIFFVLSGYLITGVLLDAKGQPNYFRDFFARRALRIFPAYYVFLFFCFHLAPSLGLVLAPTSSSLAPWFWFYGSNVLTVFHGWPDPVLAHLWSLAVEEHFYLAWPMLVLVLPLRYLKAATLIVALGSAGLRSWALSQGFGTDAVYVFTLTRLDALAAGATLCAVLRSPSSPPPWLTKAAARGSLVFGFLALAAVGSGQASWGTWSPVALSWRLPLLAVGLTAGLAHALTSREDHPFRLFLRHPLLLTTGRLSYGIYLYHMVPVVVASHLGLGPIDQFVQGEANWPYWILYSLVQVMITFAASELSFRFLEGPLLRCKDRVFPRRYQPAT